MLQCVRTIFLAIRCVERYVCFWSSWLTGPSSLSTMVLLSSVNYACISSCSLMLLVGASFPKSF